MRTLLNAVSAAALLSAAGLALSGEALASGFSTQNESGVAAMGSAFAGQSAGGDELATIFANPAGMTRLDGIQAEFGAAYVNPQIQFNKTSATNAIGQNILGGNSNDAARGGPVPSGFAMYALGDFRFGLGITTPFALKTHYTPGWVGRYNALDSEITVIDINPNVAYRISDILSVGAGISASHMSVKLTSAVDFGTILFGATPAALRPFVPYRPNNLDGVSDLRGDDWGVGFNFGFLLEPTPTTRVGISYRSEVDQNLAGQVNFIVPAVAQAGLNAAGSQAFKTSAGGGKFTLPQKVSFGVKQKVTEQLTLAAGVDFTGWSSFKQLSITFANPAQPTSSETENWQDTWSYQVGATYDLMPELQLRAGYLHDDTPTRNEYRTPRIPDGTRDELTIGAGYQITDMLRIDASYLHAFVDSATTNISDAVGNRLAGSFNTSIDVFSVSTTIRF